MNSYEVSASFRKKGGLLITLRLGNVITNPLPGEPTLDPLPSSDPSVLLFRLIFRQSAGSKVSSCCTAVREPSPQLQTIRILLPNYQEFILLRKSAEVEYLPVPSEALPWGSKG